MEREGQIGKQPEAGISPIRTPRVPRVWREFNAWVKQTPGEVRVQGTAHGQWPEGTPAVFVDLYTKTTVEERLLGSIFNDYPSVDEIQARPADYVAKMNEERASRRRERLASQLGEPEDSTANLAELEAKHAQTFGTLREQVEQVLGSLTSRERQVLQGRFGLTDGKSRTLKQMGEEIGYSPRTVGKIEKRALEKLRHPSSSRRLNDHLDLEL
ncbi:MAG: hypothetical protein A3C27_02700 [Candidatus Levybacteria bacterium RIFCSPHIGHO2_02_FULL_39_36]|nr:MAG: RNA polymerase sigma factor [Candidatus Levybacteria bacterium GW2011_GWB1_39_7]KKR49528.1 MAG: RNA polymerase sigma factor [Candidatus Levybacteria bacterium GW2011_GWA2_40_16]OGH15396.1 MAG: hypothetical protein A2689_02405 [Candidatus Levybacteria bacterium RIFCSPHIGHO2_01_FULL_38_96]OGH26033.1 MAG: hypothetical protein A3E68_01865 [Candidatus Levybacteria bacterium RIFCSPHIGHO2_12_FULL_39_39]OGH27537.1 MAG: hypothetical protein A3C27_02700 [Candidatus Levybacteria bacterium RIFCSPHI